MSRIGQWVLEQEQDGALIYIEGRGYVTPDDFTSEYMKSKKFDEEMDAIYTYEDRFIERGE